MPKANLKVIPGKAKNKIEDDVDGLFRVPLAEFISARKTLAATLKKEGRSSDAERVKMLAKPSVSAWVVNQLYWKHREAFDELMSTGVSIRDVQSGRGGKGLSLRTLLEERREVLAQLSDLAETVLQDAGHNPSLDMLRRIATTLEAMTAYASLPDGLSAGRLTKDIDPPGFDSFGSFAPPAGTVTRAVESAANTATRPSAAAVKAQQKSTSAAETQRLKQLRQAKLAAAKASLQQAKKSLAAARATAKRLEVAQKKTDTEAREAGQRRRDAERRLKDAVAASDAANKRSREIAGEADVAKKSILDANLAVTRASAELELLFRES